MGSQTERQDWRRQWSRATLFSKMPWKWEEDTAGFHRKVRTPPKGKGKGKGQSPDSGTSQRRRDEWRCRCGTHNFLERNWCRLCGRDYTHGELVTAAPVQALGVICAQAPAAPASASQSESTSMDTGDGEPAPTPVAQKIRLRKALLAAARQGGDTPEANAEVSRHEAELERLTAEEKAAVPAEARLRSLLDRRVVCDTANRPLLRQMQQ